MYLQSTQQKQKKTRSENGRRGLLVRDKYTAVVECLELICRGKEAGSKAKEKGNQYYPRQKWEWYSWGFPGGPVVKNPPSNAGGLGLSPRRETRSHVPQLRVCTPQLKLRTPQRTVRALKNWCFWIDASGVGEDSWESLGLQGDPTSPS